MFKALPTDVQSAIFTDFEGDQIKVKPVSGEDEERHFVSIIIVSPDSGDQTEVWLSPVEAFAFADVVTDASVLLGRIAERDGSPVDAGDPTRPAFEVV